tara:strand:+ start:1216 stop:1578 length:363 start_codon:yes stop_codon:yes gene_type:complete
MTIRTFALSVTFAVVALHAAAQDEPPLAGQKVASLPANLGTAYGRSLDAVIDRHWPLWVTETRAGLRHQPALAGALSDELPTALAGRGFAPGSSEIVVRPRRSTRPQGKPAFACRRRPDA